MYASTYQNNWKELRIFKQHPAINNYGVVISITLPTHDETNYRGPSPPLQLQGAGVSIPKWRLAAIPKLKTPNKCAAIATSTVAAFPPGNQPKCTPLASVSSAEAPFSPSNKALNSSKNQCKIWRQQLHPLLPTPNNYDPVYPFQQPHPTNNINITMVSNTEYPSSSSSIRKLSSFYH